MIVWRFILLRAFRVLALITFYISASLAHSSFMTNTTALASVDVPFSVEHTEAELSFGTQILTVFTDLNKFQISQKTLRQMIKKTEKIKIYDNFSDILKRLEIVTNISDNDSFYQNCTIKFKGPNTTTESIDDRFNISIDSLCRNLYLKRMLNLAPTVNLSTRDLQYFTDAVPFYLEGESSQDFIFFLKHFKNNLFEHEKLANIVMEKVVETKIRPSANVISQLKVSTTFNKYLQSKINTDDSSLSYFQEEFQKTTRDLQDAIESGDIRLAKQLSIGLRRFYNQNKNFISDKRAFIGFIICAKAFFNKDKEEEANLLFEFAKNIAPKEEFSDAHFYLIWPYVTTRDFKGLKKAIQAHSLDKNFDKFDSKLQYWIALSEKTHGDLKRANELFEKIVATNPYSFYSIVSLKELALDPQNKLSDDKVIEKLVSKSNPLDIGSNKFAPELSNALKRLSVWSKLGSERFSTLEIRKIQTLTQEETFKDVAHIKGLNEKSHREFITLNLIKYLNSKKRYISSFKIFQEAIDQNSLNISLKTLKHLFPLNYFDIIKKNALNLDPLIIISLMRQESAFNPEAMSGVGAKGLMQLMPATAKRFNSKVKVKHLSNPEINVAIGTKYLRQLFARFDGNIIYALASYNAGENRIDRWKRELFKTDNPLSTIETIPYEETRNYVKLIYRNYFFYSLLQNKSILKIPIEDSFKLEIK